MRIAETVVALQDAFDRATASQPLHCYTLEVAGRRVELRFAGSALVPRLLPALAHLVVNGAGPTPEIILQLWDSRSTGIARPPLPFGPGDYQRYGQRAVAHTQTYALMHAATQDLVHGYDRTTGRGLFWLDDPEALTIYERAAPLQTLFYWALAPSGWQIIHAAAVGTAGDGVLLVGNTGAGKSTTALSCLADSPLRVLSDDKCLIQLGPVVRAFGLFSAGKVKTDMLARLPHLQQQIVAWDGDQKVGKGLIHLYPAFAGQLTQELAIHALLLPAVTRMPEPMLRPATAADAFRQLGPSTVIWLPGAEAENYRLVAALVQALPCYHLALATDPRRNTDAIAELLARL